VTRFPVAGFLLAVLVAGGIGFGASHYLDTGAMQQLAADRDQARDCRRSGETLAPCPVIYKNTKIEWRDRIQTVEVPDRKQTTRIAMLTAELAEARQAIGNLERRRAASRAPRLTAAYYFQNGSMAHPYISDDRCAPGTVVVYEAPSGSVARRSGDPNVCYVRRLAFSSQER
jgi:hypothetical protein